MQAKIQELYEKYPIVAGFLTMMLVMGVFHLISFVVGMILDIETNYYIVAVIVEGLSAIVVIQVMKLNGTAEILRERGKGIVAGLAASGYLIFIIVVTIISNIATIMTTEGAELQPVGDILIFLIYMILIGVFEELLFRGIVFVPIIRKYGKDEQGVWVALLFSGVVFGALHLTNILAGASIISVIVQAVVAGGLGILLAAIYLRCGTIYCTILLHAVIDLVALLPSGIFGIGSMMDTLSTYQPIQMFSCVIYLAVTAFLLRSTKMDEILSRIAQSNRKVEEE